MPALVRNDSIVKYAAILSAWDVFAKDFLLLINYSIVCLSLEIAASCILFPSGISPPIQDPTSSIQLNTPNVVFLCDPLSGQPVFLKMSLHLFRSMANVDHYSIALSISLCYLLQDLPRRLHLSGTRCIKIWPYESHKDSKKFPYFIHTIETSLSSVEPQ